MARHGMDSMARHVKAVNKRVLVIQYFSSLHTLNNIITAPPM
jgi:hypothetical protein